MSAIKDPNRFIVILFSLVLLYSMQSCGKKTLSANEYIRWVEAENHGLMVKKELNDLQFGLLYKPIDYLIAQEYRNKILSADKAAARKEELSDMEYFTLSLKSNTETEVLKHKMRTEGDYFQRLEYLTSNVQNDISLIEGTDTIPCGLCHYERNYGLSPYANIVLGFKKASGKNEKQDRIFVYDDQIWGVGKIMLKISNSDIDNVPFMKLN